MRALRDFNLPKIIVQDLEIFMRPIGDLFPNIDVPRKRNMEFEGHIEGATKEVLLWQEPEFILKIVQLRELLELDIVSLLDLLDEERAVLGKC